MALGTAVAVASKGNSTLLTAGHCVKNHNSADYYCCLKVTRSKKGDLVVPQEPFKVSVVVFSSTRPNFAILLACGPTFRNPPELVVKDELPWLKQPENWKAQVTVFQCPVESVTNLGDEFLDSIQCNVDDPINVNQGSEHHFKLSTPYGKGSSGGGVFLGNKLIGILIRNTTPGISSMEDAEMVIGSFPNAKENVQSKYEADSNSVVSLSSPSTYIPISSTIAIIPCNLTLRVGKNREILSVKDFLVRGLAEVVPLSTEDNPPALEGIS